MTVPPGLGAPLPQVERVRRDADQRGKVVEVSTQEGGTLTFGDQMFAWEELDAAVGEYIIGFIVEDLDGNSIEVFETVTVE